MTKTTIVEHSSSVGTVLPDKSDSGVMFCLQNYNGLSIDHSCINPICSIGLIHK